MEGVLIACEKPTVNKQVHCFIAKLFPRPEGSRPKTGNIKQTFYSAANTDFNCYVFKKSFSSLNRRNKTT